MKIGFIGLGNMGAPMATNLVTAGYAVTGFDVSAPCPQGVTTAESAIAAATDQDVVITMLPDGQTVRDVAQTILPVMNTTQSGSLLIDCSTVDVDTARALSVAALERGLRCLDAPVSGGVNGATSGTLTFMVGGDSETFESVRPLFDVMGQKAVFCGDTGNGQAAKICNNMIMGATMVATCEAFVLADKLGLERTKMFDVVSTSSGSSWSMLSYCPAPGVGPASPADNDYKPGFSADLMLKDLRLSQQAASSVGADTPMGQLAENLYETFVEQEDGSGMDVSAMLLHFEKNTGKS